MTKALRWLPALLGEAAGGGGTTHEVEADLNGRAAQNAVATPSRAIESLLTSRASSDLVAAATRNLTSLSNARVSSDAVPLVTRAIETSLEARADVSGVISTGKFIEALLNARSVTDATVEATRALIGDLSAQARSDVVAFVTRGLELDLAGRTTIEGEFTGTQLLEALLNGRSVTEVGHPPRAASFVASDLLEGTKTDWPTSGAFTVAFWLYVPSAFTGASFNIAHVGTSGPNRTWWLRVQESAGYKIQVLYYRSGDALDNITLNDANMVDQWNLVTVKHDGSGGITLRVRGPNSLDVSSTETGAVLQSSADTLHLDTGREMRIASFGYWNEELSSDQEDSLWNDGDGQSYDSLPDNVNGSSLIEWFDLNELEGTRAGRKGEDNLAVGSGTPGRTVGPDGAESTGLLITRAVLALATARAALSGSVGSDAFLEILLSAQVSLTPEVIKDISLDVGLDARSRSSIVAEITRALEMQLSARGGSDLTLAATRTMLADLAARATLLGETGSGVFLQALLGSKFGIDSNSDITRGLSTVIGASAGIDAAAALTMLLDADLAGRSPVQFSLTGIVELLTDLSGSSKTDFELLRTKLLSSDLGAQLRLDLDVDRTVGLDLLMSARSATATVVDRTAGLLADLTSRAELEGIAAGVRALEIALDGKSTLSATIFEEAVPTDRPLDVLVDRVCALLDRLGKEIDLEVVSTKTYDSSTGSTTFGTTTHQVQITPPYPVKRKYEQGTVGRKTTVRTYLCSKTLTPEVGMTVTLDGVKFKILKVGRVYTGEKIALYELEMEGDGLFTADSATTDLDDRLLPSVHNLVERLGKLCRFTLPGSRTYDPITGRVTESSITTQTLRVTPPAPFNKKYIEAGIAEEGDMIAYLPGRNLTFQPAFGQDVKLILEGETWNVIGIGPIFSGEQVVLWELHLRR